MVARHSTDVQAYLGSLFANHSANVEGVCNETMYMILPIYAALKCECMWTQLIIDHHNARYSWVPTIKAS